MLEIIVVLLFAHYFADFMVQPEKWAVNKGRDVVMLTKHILVYSLSFFAVTWLFLIPNNWNTWLLFLIAAVLNGIIHFFIDYTTSRINRILWAKKNTSIFWKVIGLDQLLHYITIAVIYVRLYEIIYQIH
jgi:hypothetical protein